MKNELILKEKTNFMGIEIPIIEGGFGEGQKVILAKTVAEIHGVETKYINKLINNNIDKFGVNDLVDCLSSSEELRKFARENGLIGSNRTQNVFILSQRGYTKLVAMMDNSNDKKWDVMNNLIDDYFNMRVQLKEQKLQISKKQQLQLEILNGGELERIQALGEYTTLITDEATKPLLEKIEKDEPLVAFADRVMNKGENILVRELAKIISDEGYSIGEKRLYKQLREWGYIFQNSTEPTQRAIDNGYFVRITRMIKTVYGEKETFTTKVTPKGQIKITERILKENNL